MPGGQFNPIPGDPTIKWRVAVKDGSQDYFGVVELVRGSTRGDGRLTVFSEGLAIHRSAVVVKESPLFGVNPTNEGDWEAEIYRVIQNPDARSIRED